MIEVLTHADAWRLAAAAVAVGVLFLLAVGLTLHGDTLARGWRVVLWAVTGQQGILAYAAVDRALDRRFPNGVVDLPLVAIVLSTLLLLVAVAVVTFAGHNPVVRSTSR